MPWEKSYDETQVLECAARAFWTKGFEATSMADLVRETGINRGSIYAAFTDKRGLFLKALDHYDRIYRAGYLDRIDPSLSPAEAILKVFEDAARPAGDRPGGCLLVNTALELSPHDPEIAAFVDERLRAVEDFFRDRIRDGRDSRAMPPRVKPRSSAQALLSLFLGLRVLTRSSGRPAATDAILEQVRAMLR